MRVPGAGTEKKVTPSQANGKPVMGEGKDNQDKPVPRPSRVFQAHFRITSRIPILAAIVIIDTDAFCIDVSAG